jgi:hypothetical protein
MTEAVTINNEELAILCDIVSRVCTVVRRALICGDDIGLFRRLLRFWNRRNSPIYFVLT